MSFATAVDNAMIPWARWNCLAYTPRNRITIRDQTFARFDLVPGDRCGLDADRAPNIPQRAMLVPANAGLAIGVPTDIALRLQVAKGDISDALWTVLAQLMPQPDRDSTWPHKAVEPYPSPELALEILTEKGVEYLRVVTRTYPDKVNKVQTYPGLERCRWPLVRGKDYRIAMRYVSAQGQPTGALRITVNGQVLCDLSGIATGSNDDFGPYPSFGIYREGHASNRISVFMSEASVG